MFQQPNDALPQSQTPNSSTKDETRTVVKQNVKLVVTEGTGSWHIQVKCRRRGSSTRPCPAVPWPCRPPWTRRVCPCARPCREHRRRAFPGKRAPTPVSGIHRDRSRIRTAAPENRETNTVMTNQGRTVLSVDCRRLQSAGAASMALGTSASSHSWTSSATILSATFCRHSHKQVVSRGTADFPTGKTHGAAQAAKVCSKVG